MANEGKSDERPVEGDTYECKGCGMAILVTADCNCEGGDGAFFACCGEQLTKRPRAA